MTPRQLLGQHLFVGVSGLALTSEEKTFLTRENVGGVILFARNIQSPLQVFELCAEIQSLRTQTASQAPFFISVDQEGGRVARLKEPFTLWPPLRALGAVDSPTASFNFSLAMGRELRSVGINMDYAPCLDVFTNPKNTVIGDRALSEDFEKVGKHASALVRGFVKAEIIPCAKHFPGHGNTLIDSHHDLPVEDADLKRIESVELVPFAKAFKSGLELVMSAHILFPKIDPEWPATLSEIFLKDVLRRHLRFSGVVTTDDMDMKALAKNYDRDLLPVRALQAGNDILLYCNEPESPPRALEALEKALQDGTLKEADLRASLQRISDLKTRRLKDPITPTPIPTEWKSPQAHRELSTALREGRVPSGLSMG